MSVSAEMLVCSHLFPAMISSRDNVEWDFVASCFCDGGTYLHHSKSLFKKKKKEKRCVVWGAIIGNKANGNDVFSSLQSKCCVLNFHYSFFDSLCLTFFILIFFFFLWFLL